MSYEDALEEFGLPAAPQHRAEIRRLLTEEVEKEKRGESGEEMLRVLCVQLFSLGEVEDALLFWAAKTSGFDVGCGLDVQFLCGAGLPATKEFLSASSASTAAAALQYLNSCEEAGDFEGWTPQLSIERYRKYFGL